MRAYIRLTHLLLRADRDHFAIGEAADMALAEEGISEAELARWLSRDLPDTCRGRKRGYVQQRRSLWYACPDLQDTLRRGELDWTVVLVLFVVMNKDKTQHDEQAESLLAHVAVDDQRQRGMRLDRSRAMRLKRAVLAGRPWPEFN